MLEVLLPLSIVFIAVTSIEILSSSLTDTVLEVTLIDITIRIVGGTFTSIFSGDVFLFTIFGDQNVFWGILLVCHYILS
jgi:hypothetical protein